MFCSISGNVPEDPVVSKSGHLYEKRLIEEWIQNQGTDPVTGESLSQDDLIAVKANKTLKPRPNPANSIPGMLGLFHNEWDAVMLETYKLRQALATARQELSTALYQQDAAVRVIARLKRERDQAREALSSLQDVVQQQESELKDAREAGERPAKKAKAGITDELQEQLAALNQQLSKWRKNRDTSQNLAKPDAISSYGIQHSQPLHSTTQGGIHAIEVSQSGSGDVVFTGGADSVIKVFNSVGGDVLQELRGHQKKVTCLSVVGDQCLASGSNDNTVQVWRAGEGDQYERVAVMAEHSDNVVCVKGHPIKTHYMTASKDGTWCFMDIEAGICVTQVRGKGDNCSFSAAALHPDGMVWGTAEAQGAVNMWDLRDPSAARVSLEGYEEIVNGMSFSENGFHCATAGGHVVKLWDLRRMKKINELTPHDNAPTTCVSFDKSGHYLACGGLDARIYAVKQSWSLVNSFTDMPRSKVHSIAFGTDALRLFVGGVDHNLRIFGAVS